MRLPFVTRARYDRLERCLQVTQIDLLDVEAECEHLEDEVQDAEDSLVEALDFAERERECWYRVLEDRAALRQELAVAAVELATAEKNAAAQASNRDALGELLATAGHRVTNLEDAIYNLLQFEAGRPGFATARRRLAAVLYLEDESEDGS